MAPLSVSRRATPAPDPVEAETGLFGLATGTAQPLFVGLCGWLLLAPTYWSGVWVADYNFWPQALVLLCGAALAVLAAISRLKTPRFSATTWLFCLFLGWTLVTVFTASYKHDAWIELARITGAFALYFLVRLFPSPSHRLALVLAALLGLVYPSLIALWDFAHTHNARQFGTFQNPNWFASALAMALPLALILPIGTWSRTRHQTVSWLAVLPLLVLLPALAVTSSKGGFIAAIVALIVTIVTLRAAKKDAFGRAFRRALPVIAVGTLIFALLVAKTVGPRLLQARGGDDNSTQFRAYLWRSTLKMVEARPIVGHGPGAFPDTYPYYALVGYARTAHQSWLQIAAESGVPALLLLLAAVGCATASGVRALRTPHWALAAGALGAVVALLVGGCFDAGWSTPSILLMCAFALALLDVPASESQSITQVKDAGLNWGWFGAALLLLLAGYGTRIVAQGEDANADSKALLTQAPPLPEQALQKAQQGVEVDPSSGRNWVQLGRLQAALRQSGWQASIQKAIDLQPNRSQNYRYFAGAYEELSDTAQVEIYLQKALERDPLNTSLLLERAKWRLDRKDGRGYADLGAILKLWDAPYGRYPALADWVNLDFARAVVEIAPQLKGRQNARLQALVKRAQDDVTNARVHQSQNEAILQQSGTDSSLSANKDLDTLESQLKEL